MKHEDISHLATLARIRLTSTEIEALQKELSSIVEYVSVVTDIAGESADEKAQVGARFNVFRSDEITNQPDQYTKDILSEMPHTEGRYMKVKKILNIEE
jgi:aspartyl-tRNA(Asn)/glutamyl-tRNA(Gln) amidotransferase subunit C